MKVVVRSLPACFSPNGPRLESVHLRTVVASKSARCPCHSDRLRLCFCRRTCPALSLSGGVCGAAPRALVASSRAWFAVFDECRGLWPRQLLGEARGRFKPGCGAWLGCAQNRPSLRTASARVWGAGFGGAPRAGMSEGVSPVRAVGPSTPPSPARAPAVCPALVWSLFLACCCGVASRVHTLVFSDPGVPTEVSGNLLNVGPSVLLFCSRIPAALTSLNASLFFLSQPVHRTPPGSPLSGPKGENVHPPNPRQKLDF